MRGEGCREKGKERKGQNTRWLRKKGEGERERESKVRERKGKKRECVYADEICRPQQPPVKRNRISSPPGENLQECRWRIVAHRFLSWTLRGPHTPTYTHTDIHTHRSRHSCTHLQQTKNSVFRSLLFSPKGISSFPLIHKNMIVRDWNRKIGALNTNSFCPIDQAFFHIGFATCQFFQFEMSWFWFNLFWTKRIRV